MQQTESAEFASLVKRQYLLLNQHIDEMLRGHGIARSQFQVLFHVNRAGTLTQRQLLDIMKIEPATLCGIIDVLEQKNWLERQPNSKDRRLKSLSLTAKGKQTLGSIPNPADTIAKQMLKDFGKADKAQFKQFIQQSITNLEQDRGQ